MVVFSLSWTVGQVHVHPFYQHCSVAVRFHLAWVFSQGPSLPSVSTAHLCVGTQLQQTQGQEKSICAATWITYGEKIALCSLIFCLSLILLFFSPCLVFFLIPFLLVSLLPLVLFFSSPLFHLSLLVFFLRCPVLWLFAWYTLTFVFLFSWSTFAQHLCSPNLEVFYF